MSQHDISLYLRGDALYGDDFSEEEIRNWFEDERRAYFELGRKRSTYQYVYHAMNRRFAYRWLPKHRFKHVLGLGSAYGDEFLPIIDQIDRLTIVEPCEDFRQSSIQGTPVTYVAPKPSGDLPDERGCFDLITCFGVLHHIANVSHVIRECNRCLSRDGYMLLREPIVSMGDWRKPRGNLTKRERGIPLGTFRKILGSAGFQIVRENLHLFGPFCFPWHKIRKRPLTESSIGVSIDGILSAAFAWNYRYHAENWWQKLRPVWASYVLRHPA